MRAYHFAVALAALTAVSACGGSAAPKGPGPTTTSWGGIDDCYKAETFSRDWMQMVQSCTAAVARTDKISVAQLANARYHLGKAQVELGQYQQAAASLGPIIGLDPSRDDVRVELARAQAGNGDANSALTNLNEVLLRNPANAAARMAQAEVYRKRNLDGDQDLALRNLDLVMQSTLSARPEVDPVREARRQEFLRTARGELVNTALAVGRNAMETYPRTLANARRAEDAYERAKNADPSNAEIYVRLGEAQLLSAGLSASPPVEPFSCVRGSADQIAVDRARLTLEQAVARAPTSSDANRGLGCALRALGGVQNLRRAVDALQVAAANGPSDVRLQLAHAQKDLAAAIGAESPGGAGSSPQARQIMEAAISNYKLATEQGAQSGPQTYLDIADAYLTLGESANDASLLEQARVNIERATATTPLYIPAYLKLGEFYKRRGDDAKAYDNLAIVNSNATAGIDDASRAEALYLMSQMIVEGRGRNRSTLSDAVDYANRAKSLGVDPKYQVQACYAHIRSGQVLGRSQGQAQENCISGERTPEALLLRGIFHLRQSHYTSSIPDQQQRLQDALQSFREGVTNLTSAASTSDPKLNPTWAKLTYGWGQVEICIGLAADGKRRQDEIGVGLSAAEAHYRMYGVNKCNP